MNIHTVILAGGKAVRCIRYTKANRRVGTVNHPDQGDEGREVRVEKADKDAILGVKK